MLLSGLLLLAAQPGGGCAVSVTARADGSFAQAGYDSSPARLARLASQTRARFEAAATRLCKKGVLRPADLRRFGHLVVQNGEGATEAIIYRVEGMAPKTFVFQFAFQDGGPPPPSDFDRALRCWKRPQGDGCYED